MSTSTPMDDVVQIPEAVFLQLKVTGPGATSSPAGECTSTKYTDRLQQQLESCKLNRAQLLSTTETVHPSVVPLMTRAHPTHHPYHAHHHPAVAAKSRRGERCDYYRGGGDAHHRVGDAYYRGGDAHHRGGDAHHRGGDAHHRGDTYQRGGDAYQRGGDAYQRGGDAYQRGGDAYQRGGQKAAPSQLLARRGRKLAGTSAITGLLNKMSTKNVESLLPKFLAAAQESSIDAVTTETIKYCVKQPMYMHIFLRFLGELSTKMKPAVSVATVSDCLTSYVLEQHMSTPFLTTIPPDVSSVDDYDAFCLYTKKVKELLSTVTFVVSCIRAHLITTVTIEAYTSYLCSGLQHVQTQRQAEIVLEVFDAFLKACGPLLDDTVGLRYVLTTWAAQLDKADLLSPRGRFLLMDLNIQIVGAKK